MRHRPGRDLVDASGYSIKELFDDNTFELDYFQREYVWEESQVEKLLTDLADKFIRNFDPDHDERDVEEYQAYFLGLIIVHHVGDRTYLADGQQRVITLLLLLIYLWHLTDPEDPSGPASRLSTMITKSRLGRTTFAVDVEMYEPCFNALLRRHEFGPDGLAPNVLRVWRAYQHIDKHFPHQLRGESLPLFIEYLLHRVSLVAVWAKDQKTAIEMFQSMNDRGVHLTPMDHLKRYLLEKAEDHRAAESLWHAMVAELESVERGAAFAYLQTVFRARYADSADEDGPSLENATHEWVRAHQKEIWPDQGHGNRSTFLTDVLVPLKDSYLTLLRARLRMRAGLEAVRYNAAHGITAQFDVALAAMRPADSKTSRQRKAALVANLIDLFVVTNALNNDPCDQGAVNGLVAELLPQVRRCHSEEDLRRVLGRAAAPLIAGFAGITTFRFRNNRRFVHYLLTRLTAWLEVAANREDPTDRMLKRSIDDRGFEIEHLFPKDPAKHTATAPDPDQYGYLRSRFGALVLLDGPNNGAYRDMPLAEKVPHYRSETILAASLDSGFLTGRGNARIRRFIRTHGLTGHFVPYVDGSPLEELVDARGRLYRAMAERIWSLDALGLTAPADDPPAGGKPKRARRNHGVRLEELVAAGLVKVDDRLVGHRRRKPYYAVVRPGGRIRTQSGSEFGSPSAAAMDVLETSAENGWTFWHVDRTGRSLDRLRSDYKS